ncbi:hypothetical protein [Stagnihabitans tardus]|uniref:Uncharacterized protein n=1 Tax=Stagnihabitans tardus TaxID=2699202 RepID=A0AAE4YDH0_9RHOB|nr:hypothetical protein [Stagnihabitans tardus]NBZ89657.1 hypothetical protein [Stagnihabitans tardus]
MILLGMDFGVQLALTHGAPQSLVRFFDYGRSVPGKFATWAAQPDLPGNLRDVAWRDAMMRASAEGFAAETASAVSERPVIRAYGMSFLNNILDAAQKAEPDLRIDRHSGPGAPVNATYAMFLDDRPNRRAGDVVVLGVLSDTLEGMFSLSNRTWVFEQPAPYTYPVFSPDPAGTGLIRTDPLVQSLAEEERLASDPARSAAWEAQLAELDRAHMAAAFRWPLLDASPLVRLLRRSQVMPELALRRKAAMAELSDPASPGAETLRRILAAFAAEAREDGQVPIVALIQGNRPAPDLAALCPALRAQGVTCFATSEIQDPRDPAAFLGDGHFRPEVDARLGAAFLELLPPG